MGPSDRPTVEPTQTPTLAPTDSPTTLSPTTNEPSFAPSATPTEDPTEVPTLDPTVSPTDAPTSTPSEEPTAAPTSQPSLAPTVAPSTDAPLAMMVEATHKHARRALEKALKLKPELLSFDPKADLSMVNKCVEAFGIADVTLPSDLSLLSAAEKACIDAEASVQNALIEAKEKPLMKFVKPDSLSAFKMMWEQQATEEAVNDIHQVSAVDMPEISVDFPALELHDLPDFAADFPDLTMALPEPPVFMERTKMNAKGCSAAQKKCDAAKAIDEFGMAALEACSEARVRCVKSDAFAF